MCGRFVGRGVIYRVFWSISWIQEEWGPPGPEVLESMVWDDVFIASHLDSAVILKAAVHPPP